MHLLVLIFVQKINCMERLWKVKQLGKVTRKQRRSHVKGNLHLNIVTHPFAFTNAHII